MNNLKTRLTTLSITIIFVFTLVAQKETSQILVPFKVADHFGIATPEGKMQVQPTFDYIELGDIPNIFTGFNYNENGAYKTALIVNDNVLLKDQDYFGYYHYDGLIFAVKHTSGKGSGYYSFSPEAIDIYDLKGKRISQEAYKYASVINDLDKNNNRLEELLYMMHTDGTYSVVVYDKKLGKFTTTFVDRAKDFDFIELDMVFYTKAIHIKYIDANNQGHELKIGLKDQKFVKTFEGTFTVEKNKNLYDYYDDIVEVPEIEMERPPAPKVTKSEITMDVIEISKDYKGYRPSTIKFETKQLDPRYFKLVFEGEKRGVYYVKKEQTIVEPVYDAVYSTSFRGTTASGYILKKDKVYTIKMQSLRGEELPLNGSFKHLPYVSYVNYVVPNTHIISLYDTDGKFLYYADQDGNVFYREK